MAVAPLIALILTSLVAACSTDTTASPAQSESALASPPPAFDAEAVLQDYFPVIAQGSKAAVLRAKRVALPGSPAEVFADHQVGMIEGAQASANQQPWSISSTVLSAEEVDWSASFASRYSDRSQFTDFVFDPSGRLITWNITPRTHLEDAVGLVDRSAQYSGVAFSVSTGYRASDGALQLAYAGTGPRKDAGVQVGGYLQGGARRNGIVEPYRLDLSPRAEQAGLSIFPRSDFGGRLLVSSYYPVEGAAQILIEPRPWPRSVTRIMEGTDPQ